MGWRFGVLPAVCAAAIAVLVLLGVLTGVDWIQSFGGVQPTLPITAVGILVAGAGLLWRRELGGLVVGGGPIPFVNGLGGSDRVAVNTAVCIVLAGVGLLALRRRPAVADGCALLI